MDTLYTNRFKIPDGDDPPGGKPGSGSGSGSGDGGTGGDTLT
ncbi:hypothetical protein [Balneola vulgaris]|nr:hypothetical protein [Balneola vulgaris]